ncbi:MAG: hypothetical protein V1735_00375 [Nanoarchaeota archaeon]
MIGKPEWFTYRIFGWGLRPKTWQGWVYILAWLGLFGIWYVLPLEGFARQAAFIAILGIGILDVLVMMLQLDKVHDERQRMHQLVIERNCSYAALATIIGVIIVQSSQRPGLAMPFDSSLAIVLGAMLLAKVLSTIYVNVKM